MKKMLVIFCFVISACAPEKDEDATGSGNFNTDPDVAYSSCEQVPSAPAPLSSHNCPGAVSTWNNYEIIKDSNGVVLSIELWCGATNQDFPATQTEYNSTMIFSGYTTRQDYKSGLDCASGSQSSASGSVVNVWQQQ